MTQPTPADEKAAADKAAAEKAAKSAPALLTVGHFRHRDHILGGEHDRFGVVVGTGDALEVYPLERYTVQVDPAEFHPLKPDDLG
jgi:hypothetical protein